MSRWFITILVLGLVLLPGAGAQWPVHFNNLTFSTLPSTEGGKLLFDNARLGSYDWAIGSWTAFTPSLPTGHPWEWIEDHQFYCVDLSHGFEPADPTWDLYPTNYEDLSTTVSGFQGTEESLARAAGLYNMYAGYAQSHGILERAGLQIAIWEAIYDGDQTFFGNLAGGADQGYFYVDWDVNNSDVRPLAEYYLTHAPIDLGVAGYYADHQKLLGPIVPEPGTLMLLGVGLVGSGIAVLRRKRR